MVSYIVHTHTKHKNSSAGNGSAKDFQEEFCDLNHSASAVFLELLLPWLDFLLRVLSPFACLTTYNAFILRKIWREDRCAQRLMDKVGIVAPLWFHVGLLQARHTVRRTSLLTASMFLCGLLLSLYSISRSIRGTDLSEKHHPTWRLLAVLTFYLNYSCLYPAYAIQDHSLLIAMRDTWRNPLVRKRGTTVASAAPKITSSSDQPSTSTTALCLLEWFCGSPEDMSQSKSVSGSPSAFTSKSMREKPLQQKSSGHLFPSKSKSQCTLHESESESESEFTGGK
ncbi:uncharacterized protein LOC143297294 [Babylonia areolata]|uniref:uncharacterized protein LOC143297294 n=1 Tax=Babylonia areolata TaxID=304850 RepID=UPI003FD3D798